MPFDAHKNLAIATIAAAPSPPSTGTLLSVAPGETARFPAAPFNATIWPANALPTPGNAEVVRVTSIVEDTFVLLRAQEGTGARAIVAGDLIAATITVKTIADIESGLNFPAITVPGSVTVGTDVLFTPASHALRNTSVDGSDTHVLYVSGGGGILPARGATLTLGGNDHATLPGVLALQSGDATLARIELQTNGVVRGTIARSGGVNWFDPADPGAGSFRVSGPGGYVNLTGGMVVSYTPPAVATFHTNYYNINGICGGISTTGSSTTYNTTSDARLKDDLGAVVRDVSAGVLEETVVHEFTWKADGTPGRGVFAQEAHAVAPFAVTVGRDDLDAEGRLAQPWAVDYGKYVPDLIVGWQTHHAQITALLATVAALEARLAALEGAPPVTG